MKFLRVLAVYILKNKESKTRRNRQGFTASDCARLCFGTVVPPLIQELLTTSSSAGGAVPRWDLSQPDETYHNWDDTKPLFFFAKVEVHDIDWFLLFFLQLSVCCFVFPWCSCHFLSFAFSYCHFRSFACISYNFILTFTSNPLVIISSCFGKIL